MKRQNISSGSPAFPGDLYNQTKRCLAIIDRAIQDTGGYLENVIRTRMFTDQSGLAY